tara:strand:- start:21280 stop:22707 length:1428 start_codon:yes stop_codon:yes gene_type:complete
MKEFDVIIIGAGTAGLSARREVAKKTDNYIVVDDGPLGTTCARVGCMPSKVLIQVANDYDRIFKLEELGIHEGGNLILNKKKVMAHTRKLRDRFVKSVNLGMEEWIDTHLVRKRAAIIDKNTLDLEGEIVKAKKIIIATGSSPIFPKAWRPYKDYMISTNDFFELEDLPDRVAVIGLGVIGAELGQALSKLEVKTYGFTIGKSVGGLTDPKIQEYAISSLKKNFENISFSGVDSFDITKTGIIVKSKGFEVEVDKIILSLGRSPNLNLGLDNLGYKQGEVPEFDIGTFQLKKYENIFLVGDVNNEYPILHQAADEGKIAGYNSVNPTKCFQKRVNLAITFSDPNIAIVGKNYDYLVKNNIDFSTGKVSYEGQGRAIVKLKEEGLMHIYASNISGKILGAEFIAPEGDHLAHLLAWAIDNQMTAGDALNQTYYHPVLEEGIRTAFRNLYEKIYGGRLLELDLWTSLENSKRGNSIR